LKIKGVGISKNALMKNEKILSDSKSTSNWSIFKEKNVSHTRKKTFYLQFCMGTPKSHQKSIFNTPKVKKNKDTHGICPTKFASST
jgi:hypothetical protein